MKFYNQRTFSYISRCMKDAEELLAKNKCKSARFVLKDAKKLLEKDREPSRMLALVYCLEAKIFEKEKKEREARHCWFWRCRNLKRLAIQVRQPIWKLSIRRDIRRLFL